MGMLMTLGACGDSREEVTVGLITKQEENPYWLALRETAEKTADDQGVTLLTATGTSDADVESQQKAIADMVAKGADGILIAPTDSAALLPAVEAARAAGVIVIALDTPFDPVDAVDAYFTTDNVRAGELVGEYAAAKAKELGMTPQVAMLGLTPGFLSGDQREAGFLVSMGLDAKDPAIVADVDTQVTANWRMMRWPRSCRTTRTSMSCMPSTSRQRSAHWTRSARRTSIPPTLSWCQWTVGAGRSRMGCVPASSTPPRSSIRPIWRAKACWRSSMPCVTTSRRMATWTPGFN
jgi:hypothetical protein